MLLRKILYADEGAKMTHLSRSCQRVWLCAAHFPSLASERRKEHMSKGGNNFEISRGTSVENIKREKGLRGGQKRGRT